MFVQHENHFAPRLLLIAIIGLLAACGSREPTLEERIAAAEAASAAGDHAAAVVLWEGLLEEHPYRVDFMESLAFAYLDAGEHLLAGFTFSQAADEEDSDPAWHLYAAESFREIDDPEAMTDQWVQYLQKRPDDHPVWRQLAEQHEATGNRSAALEAWMRTERLQASGENRIHIGRLFLDSDNLAQAQSWFARALDEFPDTRRDALYGLFETALRAGRTADAESLLAELDAIDPQIVDGSPMANARAQIRQWRERQEEARLAAEALRRRQAAEEEAAARAAEAARAERPDPATEREVAERPPREMDGPAVVDDLSPLQRAQKAMAGGEPRVAVDLLRRALVDRPEDAGLWRALSEAAHLTGDSGWAQAAASEAMRLQPDDPRHALQYIRVFSDQWTSEQWLREMEAVNRRFPNTPEIVLRLARGYLNLINNRRQARYYFDEFLRIAPENHPERPRAEAERARL